MGLLDNIVGCPGKSTTSSCTRPFIICSNSSNAANLSEPCYMSACSTHSSFASPLEREWGKPSPTRSCILYGNVREFVDSEGSSRKCCLFFLTAFYPNISIYIYRYEYIYIFIYRIQIDLSTCVHFCRVEGKQRME